MFCPNCGADNPAGAGSCTNCGQTIGGVSAPSAAAPPPTQAAALQPGLGTLLGVQTPDIQWGAGIAFLIAAVLADLVFLLIAPFLRTFGVAPLYAWLLSFSADLILTAAAMAAFRWVRNDAGAAALAAAIYTIPQVLVRTVILAVFLSGYQGGSPIQVLNSFLATFLFLLLLALAVRWIRPTMLGLWLGATGAQLAVSIVYRIASVIEMRTRLESSVPFHIDPWDVVTDLVFAAVFALVFWGGLALMAPKVLRDS